MNGERKKEREILCMLSMCLWRSVCSAMHWRSMFPVRCVPLPSVSQVTASALPGRRTRECWWTCRRAAAAAHPTERKHPRVLSPLGVSTQYKHLLVWMWRDLQTRRSSHDWFVDVGTWKQTLYICNVYVHMHSYQHTATDTLKAQWFVRTRMHAHTHEYKYL